MMCEVHLYLLWRSRNQAEKYSKTGWQRLEHHEIALDEYSTVRLKP